MFTGREDEIQKVIALLTDDEMAVVSLHGGPGFGKTAIAIQTSYKLSEDHKIPVVFSQLTTVSTVDEMIRQLCLDVGVNHEDDPKPSLILWLKNIKKKRFGLWMMSTVCLRTRLVSTGLSICYERAPTNNVRLLRRPERSVKFPILQLIKLKLTRWMKKYV